MATQKAIAEKLGISISLVSRVLSGKAKEIGVAEETIQKVLEEAKRSNYTPNSAALSLKGVKTHTLGVITYDFEDPYFGIILGELHKIAKERDFTLILSGSYQREQDTLDLSAFSKHTIEGLIIVGSDRHKDWFEDFPKKNIPIVQIGFTEHKIGINICLDKVATSTMIANYLQSQHVTTAALLFNDNLSHQTFKAQHLTTFPAQGIDIVQDITCSNDLDSIRHSLQILNPLPDIILAGDDVMATQIIRALHEKGISVPTDVKVLGFDNISLASHFIPTLSTVSPPLKDMLQKAFDVVSTNQGTTKTILFSPQLIARESA